MSVFHNLRARYSKGSLKLPSPLSLPEDTEVYVTVTPIEAQGRKFHESSNVYRTPAVSWKSLRTLEGIVSLGGDALADSEALYDGS